MLEPWMGQVGVAGALIGLLIMLGRTFIASIDRRIAEQSTAHTNELTRLERLRADEIGRLIAAHERELGDLRRRAEAWEAAAGRKDVQISELWSLTGKLQAGNDTAVGLLRALRQAQLEAGNRET